MEVLPLWLYCISLGSRMGLWHGYQCTNVGYMQSDGIFTVATSVLWIDSCFFWTAVLFIVYNEKTHSSPWRMQDKAVVHSVKTTCNESTMKWAAIVCVCPIVCECVPARVCAPCDERWRSVSSLISDVLWLSGCDLIQFLLGRIIFMWPDADD